jgi:hypothetical protein
MTLNDYKKIMLLLDLIEIELDIIAEHFNHPTMKEFFK